MSNGTVQVQPPPPVVPRSPMSPISQTPAITGAPPRIPVPPGVIPQFPSS